MKMQMQSAADAVRELQKMQASKRAKHSHIKDISNGKQMPEYNDAKNAKDSSANCKEMDFTFFKYISIKNRSSWRER